MTIIELSRKLGIGNSNGSWTNVLGQPLRVNKGSVISVKNVFIDTNSNNSTNITLENDVDIEMEIGYYVMNSEKVLPDRTYYGKLSTDHNDYNAYIMRDESYNPVLKTITKTIEKGSYTPSYLAEYVNRKLTEVELVPEMSGSHFGIRPRNPFLIRSDVLTNFDGDPDGKTKFHLHSEDESVSESDRHYFKILLEGQA